MDSYKIIAVDDDLVDLEAIKRCLRNERSIKNRTFTVTTLTSGEACLTYLKDQECDLLLLDYNMPELNGYETCRIVKKMKPELPVIILTGMTDDESIKYAFEAGADDYTTKPIKKTELIMRINNALRIKDSEFQLKTLYSGLLQDLSVASKVQSYVIPEWCKLDSNLIFTSFYQASNKVSGDLFDIIKISKTKYCVYVGDISGHGVQAALLMVAFQTVIKMFINENKDDLKLHVILNRLNRTITDNFLNKNYLTILIGIIDMEDNTFQYHTAGHPPLITYNTITEKVDNVKDSGNLPVGMLKDTNYSESDINTIKISADVAYLMYTDGVFECKSNEGKFLGLDGLTEISKSIKPTGNIVTVQEKIVNRIKQEGYLYEDDITFLGFQRTDQKCKSSFFELNPKIENVEKIVNEILAAVKNSVSNIALEPKIELICNEILNNIVIHGYNQPGTGNLSKILIEVMSSKNEIVIVFWDHGTEWKQEELHSNNGSYFTENDEFEVSGRGLKIIKTLSSSFSINRHGNINETTVCIKDVKL